MNWLLKQLNDAVRQLFDTFWPKQAFSWQTVFWLSLLSWGLTGLSYYNIDAGLLPPDSPAPSPDAQDFSRELVGTPRILFTMAWVFLTIAIGWVLAGRKWKLPIFAITLKPAIWVTSALTSLFLFEIWDADTRPLVFIAWPIIFAIYTVLPKIFQLSTGNFILPPPPIRQQLVITTLICLVISCLFRFHFIIQNWIAQEYQVLQLIDFDEGGVMQQVADPSPVLTVANLTLQNELGVLSIPEVRRWMLQADEREAELNEAFRDNLDRATGVFPVWELNIRVDAVSEPKFYLFTWPTRRDTTIGLQQFCQVVPTENLPDSEIGTRARSFNNLRLRRDIQTAESPNSTSPDSTPLEDIETSPEASEPQSLAAEIWERLSELLDDVIPSDDLEEATDAEESSEPNDNFRTSANALPLRDQPSQVICSPPTSLVLREDHEAEGEETNLPVHFLSASRPGNV